MVKVKQREHIDALKKVKELYNELDFTAGIPKGELAEGRKKK